MKEENETPFTKRALLPLGISTLRIFCAFIVVYFFYQNLMIESIIIFLIACGTDILDGVIARKLKASSSVGAYFDASADCFLIIIISSAFILNSIYPWWLLLLIGLMFLQFIVTSKLKKPIYDPIGRYCGVFYFIIIGVTLIFPDSFVSYVNLITIIVFTVLALLSRSIAFYNSSKTHQ